MSTGEQELLPGDPSTTDVFAALLSDDESEDSEERETPPADDSEPAAEPDPADESSEDSADGDESDADENPDNAEEQPELVTVMVDGEPVQVTLDEALKGYSRTADYTRKTQKLSDERKSFETEAVSVREERAKLAQYLAQLEQHLAEATPAEPDWNEARKSLSEADFVQLHANWTLHKQQMAALQEERKAAEARVREDTAKQVQAHIAKERELLFAAMPELHDEAKRTAAYADLRSYVNERGFTDAELSTVSDHRLIQVLMDAAQYHKLRKAPAPKPRPAAPAESSVKPARPGGRKSSAPEKTAAEKVRKRLAQTGSVEDAAALFLRTLPD